MTRLRSFYLTDHPSRLPSLNLEVCFDDDGLTPLVRRAIEGCGKRTTTVNERGGGSLVTLQIGQLLALVLWHVFPRESGIERGEADTGRGVVTFFKPGGFPLRPSGTIST